MYAGLKRVHAHRHCRLLKICLTVTLLLVGSALSGSAADSTDTDRVLLHFDPPENTVCRATIHITKTKEAEGLQKSIEATDAVEEQTYERTASGYTLHSKILSFEMTKDGQPVQHPVFEVLGRTATHLELDSNGQALAMTGFEGVVEALRSSLPPEAFEAIASMITPEVLAAKQMAEWQGRIGGWVGNEFIVGDPYFSESDYALPGGQNLKYVIISKISNVVTKNGIKCVTLTTQYESDAAALASFMSMTVDSIAARFDLDSPEKGLFTKEVASMSGSAELLVDPNTMLPYEETLNRVIKIPYEIPGRGKVLMSLTELRTYKYEYGSAE